MSSENAEIDVAVTPSIEAEVSTGSEELLNCETISGDVDNKVEVLHWQDGVEGIGERLDEDDVLGDLRWYTAVPEVFRVLECEPKRVMLLYLEEVRI